MTRDHFSQYRNRKPLEYQAFSNAMWNTFVSVTHTIGLSKFFSFTPDYQAKREYTAADGRFSEIENKITKD